ncbi:MAG: MSHA biogenesis protein MshN [Shewanella psychromarinicola]|jgi:MSHA biogenesis protein MshN|uniref:tetratricopeptide repeat protein n=1 Tax=Shewanella psychromarinicola TaxID=2487742 RepID=UPI003EEBE43E
MSVIIKMLKDLEQGQQPGIDNPSAPPVGEFVRPQIQYQSVAKSRSASIGLIIVAALLIPTLWFGVSMYRQANIQIVSEPGAVSASASKETQSLLSQPQDNDGVATEPPKLSVVSSTATPIQAPMQTATQANTVAITQDSIQDNVQDSTQDSIQDSTQVSQTTEASAVGSGFVATAEPIDMSSELAPQTSVKVAETVKTPAQIAAALVTEIATETVTDKPSVSGSNKTASNNAVSSKTTSNKITSNNTTSNNTTSNKIASNNTIPNKTTSNNSAPNNSAPNNSASNNIEPTQALTTAPLSVLPAQAPIVIPKPVEMTVKEVVLTKPQMAQLQYQKAMNAEQAQRLDDAAGYYLEAIILQPSLHKARKQLAKIYYGQSNFTAAMLLLESGVSLFPQQWEFYVILSQIQTQMKAYDAALSTVAMIPDNSLWARDKWIAQTDLAQKSKNFALAEAAYRHLLLSESTKPRWWMGLGYSLDSQKKYPQAAQAYRSALSYEGLSTSAMTFIEKRLDQLGANR